MSKMKITDVSENDKFAQDWIAQGRAAHKAGKVCVSPCASGTPGDEYWIMGWAAEDAGIEATKPVPLAVIDIPADSQDEAFIVFLRTKGYDANVCDSIRTLWNGQPVRWDAELSAKFDALEAEFKAYQEDQSANDDPCVIRLDGRAWGWTRDSSATRLQQHGVPEHIALSAITLAVLGGKAIVFGSDGKQITVERG